MAFKILVVDDSAVMRKIIMKNLKLCNLPLAETYEAGCGEEGLSILASHSIDLLFVDLNMPGMTGDEMVEKIRQDPQKSELPIIFVSSESRSSRIQELKHEKTRVIHKPFTLEDFQENLVSIGCL